MLRGGSWGNNQNNARAAYRNDNNPDNRNDNGDLQSLGFRVVVVRFSTPYLFSHEERVRPLFPRQLHAQAWPARDGATSGVCPTIGSRFQFMLTDYGL